MKRMSSQPYFKAVDVALVSLFCTLWPTLSRAPLDRTTLEWALTFWGGWHLTGGIISIAITMPIIGIIEKGNVRGLKNV
jgi:hypothetical protein